MDTVKKTTKNIAKSNRVIANKFNLDDEDLYNRKKGSTVLRDIAKTNNYIAERLSSVNEPNGLVELDNNGLINSDQLPSYVDDVIEGYYYNGALYSDSSHQYEIVPESDKIYIDITDPNHAQSYRWSGSIYSIIADPREALFDVTFTEPVPGNLKSDKTLAEIEEAVSNGKVVRGFFGNITYYLTSIQHDTNVKFNAAIKNINYNIEGKYLNSAWNWSYNSWDLSNIKPDWNATAGANNEILNKPSIPDTFNDLEVEATFNLIYNAFTDTYTVTCNKRASDLSNSPLIEISMIGDTYKEVAFKSSSTVTAYFNIGTKIVTFVFTDNGYSWSVVYKESVVAVTGSYNDLVNKPTIPTGRYIDPFKASWNNQSSTTTENFLLNILSDSSVNAGDIYRDTMLCSDSVSLLGANNIVTIEVFKRSNNDLCLKLTAISRSGKIYTAWNLNYSLAGWLQKEDSTNGFIYNEATNAVTSILGGYSIMDTGNDYPYILIGTDATNIKLYSFYRLIDNKHISYCRIERNHVIIITVTEQSNYTIDTNSTISIESYELDCSLSDIAKYTNMSKWIAASTDFRIFGKPYISGKEYYQKNKDNLIEDLLTNSAIIDYTNFLFALGTKNNFPKNDNMLDVGINYIGSQQKLRIYWNSTQAQGLTQTDKVCLSVLDVTDNKWYHFLDAATVSDGFVEVLLTSIPANHTVYAFLFIHDPNDTYYSQESKVSNNGLVSFFVSE